VHALDSSQENSENLSNDKNENKESEDKNSESDKKLKYFKSMWLDWLSESEYFILILSHSDLKSRWDEIFVRWNEMRSKFL